MAKSVFYPNYKKIAKILRNRVLHGDYALKPIPSERKLAEEFDVNYMTVRRSLHILVEEELLARQANGRMRVKRIQQGSKKHLNFAFVMPTLSSHSLEVWRGGMERAIVGRSCSVRPILYMHWDDPILVDSLEGFDGIFLSAIPEVLPPAVAEKLRQPQHRVVVVDYDFSCYGIPSIRLFPPVFVQHLLDHLASLGHSRIGCFNTQPVDSEVRERIDQWRYWMSAHGFVGQLVDRGVLPHENPMEQAYKVMSTLLTEGKSPETAWFFTTTPAAFGAMRAILDHGKMPGRDLAICSANGEGMAAMFNPSLTALETSDPAPFLSYCIDWMRSGQGWQGPLLMQPTEVPLAIRESTQPKVTAKIK